MERWTILLQKVTSKKLDQTKIKEQISRIGKVVERNKTRGLTALIPKNFEPPEEIPGGYRYSSKVGVVKRRVRSVEAAREYFEQARKQLAITAKNSGWKVMEDGAPSLVFESPKEKEFKQRTDFQTPKLTPDILQTIFGRIYEREAQIEIIHLASVTAAETGFRKRPHILLHGMPACAKSEIFEAFKEWYNRDTEYVMSLDATTTTKAGLETLLLQKATDDELPPFLLLEEIEKHDIKTLLSLLQVMDSRGRISRTNARVGNVSAQARIVVWATCNDENKLKNFEGGALWSRFSHQLDCARPSKELMHRILDREAKEREANTACIEKIIKFGFEELKTTDPRKFIALLDGHRNIDKYLARHRQILTAKEQERQMEERGFID